MRLKFTLCCTPNNLEIDFNKSSSILISPTKDKVIVNNNFFSKNIILVKVSKRAIMI